MSAPSEPALSLSAMSARRRRVPLALIVALDVGLALAGAAMLAKGLAKPSARTIQVDAGIVLENSRSTVDAEPPPAAPSEPTVDTSPSPPPTPSPPASSPPSRQKPPRASPSPASRKSARPSAGASKPSVGSAASATLPPTDAPGPSGSSDPHELAGEVELATTRTRPQFDVCYFNAGGASAVRGIITIAFQVSPEGQATHVTAVVNTTGSPSLAACIAAEIARWRFASRPANAANFTRTFNYG